MAFFSGDRRLPSVRGRILLASMNHISASVPTQRLCAYRVALALAIVATAAGCRATETEEQLLLPGRATGEAEAPPSAVSSVALVTEDTACVADSYFFRIHCMRRNGTTLAAWGGQGDGPGEFASIQSLVRGPDGAVAVVDRDKKRVAVFLPSGESVSQMPVPFLFFPSGPVGSTLSGYHIEMYAATLRQVELDVATGEVVWDRVYPRALARPGCDENNDDVETQGAPSGVPTIGGGMAFTSCRGQLALFPDRNRDSTVVVRSPAFAPQLPNEREVADYVDARRGSYQGDATEAEIAAFRRQPKEWYPHAPKADEAGRLWLLTSRDRDKFSYIDLFANADYLGTIRVADRVMGFDVLGATLAVLVERPAGPGDPDGMDERAVVWYDISDLP